MIKRFFAAASFLTRAPLPARWQFAAADVGRSTLFFPLIGAGLGVVNLAALRLLTFKPSSAGGVSSGALWLPSTIIAVLLVALGAWLTGALHLDGLADMADGFGGGRDRESVLRIMRDHVIGAYGAVALILLLFIKVTTLAALIEHGEASPYLLIAPALGRWASVPLGRFLPYARRAEGGLGAAVTDYVGGVELIGATTLAAVITFTLAGWRGAICWLAVVLLTWLNGRMCVRRIGGVTGDTMGANTEICEAAVLLVAVALTR